MRYIKSSDCCLFSCSVEQELQPKFVISCRCLVDLSRSPKDVITVFLPHPQVHEYLRSKLCSLYENDCIFDKFECVWNSSDRWAALGKQDLLHCEYSWKQSVWLSLSDATSCASVMPYLCQCLMFKSIPETSFVDLSSFFFCSVSLFSFYLTQPSASQLYFSDPLAWSWRVPTTASSGCSIGRRGEVWRWRPGGRAASLGLCWGLGACIPVVNVVEATWAWTAWTSPRKSCTWRGTRRRI